MPKDSKELKRKDIKFLRAVQLLCDNPDEYDHTDKGKAPANTSALKSVEWMDLSDGDLEYRMVKQSDSGANKRGFEVDGGLGYLRIYQAEPGPSGYEPRSVEITEKGRKALKAAMEDHGFVEGVPSEEDDAGTDIPGEVELEIAEIREEMADLRSEVEQRRTEAAELREEIQQLKETRDQLIENVEELSEIVEMWEERPLGAVGQQKSERIDSTIRAIPAFIDMHKNVFGLDPREFGIDQEVSVEDVRDAREEVNRALSGEAPIEVADES